MKVSNARIALKIEMLMCNLEDQYDCIQRFIVENSFFTSETSPEFERLDGLLDPWSEISLPSYRVRKKFKDVYASLRLLYKATL